MSIFYLSEVSILRELHDGDPLKRPVYGSFEQVCEQNPCIYQQIRKFFYPKLAKDEK